MPCFGFLASSHRKCMPASLVACLANIVGVLGPRNMKQMWVKGGVPD